jgi:cyclase
MLKKRLVGVITVRNGWAVQSFGYSRYLPLGRPECLAENLDRWGADEILVLSIDRSRRNLGPDLDLLGRIGGLGLATPLTYGGGIRSATEARAVIKLGADRVCVDATLRADPAAVRSIAELLGAQAVIGVLPLSVEGAGLLWRDYLTGSDTTLGSADMSLFTDRVVSEALLVDWRNEGRRGGFDASIVQRFPLQDVPLIAFGGISEARQVSELLSDPRVVACAVGNFLSYGEHVVQRMRSGPTPDSIRPAEYLTDLWHV